MKAEALIDAYLGEAGPTRGMKNAYRRMENVRECASCGLTVPRYPGRYPSKCPECGAELMELKKDK